MIILSITVVFNSCSKKDDAGTSGTPDTNYPCTNITTNTTIGEGSYLIDCALTVTNNAILTISPGVTLKFTGTGSLTTDNGGAINAIGTSSQPIIFTGKEETSGFWSGIDINTNSVNNIFSYCQFKCKRIRNEKS